MFGAKNVIWVVGKMVVYEKEGAPGRVTMILVGEKLGF